VNAPQPGPGSRKHLSVPNNDKILRTIAAPVNEMHFQMYRQT